MQNSEILKGRKILIVDDEPDILETLEEMLDMCIVDTAPNFETAKKFLKNNTYDVAILDIMGVRGYDLLEITRERGIPALMLTAHALTPDNLVKSLKSGAQSYVPKDKIAEIDEYIAEIIQSKDKGEVKSGKWFSRLKPFFDTKFGEGWLDQDRDFWKNYVADRKELEDMLK